MQNLFVHFNACDKKTQLYPEYFGIRAGIISIQPLVRTLLVTSALIGQVTPSTVVLGVHGQTQATVSHHVLALVNLNWNSNVILTCLHGLKGNICCTFYSILVYWYPDLNGHTQSKYNFQNKSSQLSCIIASFYHEQLLSNYMYHLVTFHNNIEGIQFNIKTTIGKIT